jgi:hypothetical protein
MLQLILLILIFVGIIFITINLVKNANTCDTQPQIIYRYIPRTFDEEQEDPAYASDIHKTLFSLKSPWIYNANDIEIHKQASIRDFIANPNTSVRNSYQNPLG